MLLYNTPISFVGKILNLARTWDLQPSSTKKLRIRHERSAKCSTPPKDEKKSPSALNAF